MKMMPGSHEWDGVEHEDTFDEDNLLTRGQVMKRKVDEEATSNVVLQPGSSRSITLISRMPRHPITRMTGVSASRCAM